MVKLKKCSIEQLTVQLNGRECYCFGSGDQAELFFLKHEELLVYTKGFIDNRQEKVGTCKNILGKKLPIYSMPQFLKMKNDDTVVITTSMYWMQMIEQMDVENGLDNLECYVDIVMERITDTNVVYQMEDSSVLRIPKIIHYCWFGKNLLPESFQRNILSWEKKCRGYEIKRWDESNYDIGKSDYTKWAYEAGKWAFVSDYARFDILNEFGGIYLDTDVELLKPLDPFLKHRVFFGFEKNQCIGSGLGFGSIKGQHLLQEMMDCYQALPRKGGVYQDKAYVPFIATWILKKNGFRMNGEFQCKEGVAVYPSDVFAPMDLWSGEIQKTENTYAIHHYSSTWWEKHAMENMEEMHRKWKDYLDRMEEL